MNRFLYFIMIIACCTAFSSKAQVYTQGDVTVMLQPGGTHDSNNCVTTGQMFYLITKQNSFTGDMVTVKDMTGGTIIYQDVNSSGQNPWNVMAPDMMISNYIPDYYVSGGYATFTGPPTKVISGSDTVLNIQNFFTVAVSNPCEYGNVTGKIYIDDNSDCNFNGSDIPLNAIAVGADVALNSPTSSATSSSSGSDISGDYTMQIQKSWMTGYTISIPSQYQFIFPSTACSPASFTGNNLPQTGIDFSLQCTSNMDVECNVQSAGIVRPNLPFMLFPFVNNTGCTAASGTLKLLLDTRVVYNAGLSSNPATNVVGDTLMWNYSNLSNLSNGMYWNSFFAGVYLTPLSSVNIGDTLCFQVFANTPSGDVDAGNNTATLCLPVINSYDPNFKEVSPRGTGTQGNIPQTTDKLNYTIHFQNTGTAVAYNIYVIDTLDSDVQSRTLDISGTSHSMQPQWLAPNVVKFSFNNINLPDSASNEALSHGFVSFSVKLNSSLPIGRQITNKAYIYFDSNPAIVTNTTLNTIANMASVEEIKLADFNVKAFPNPFTDNITFVIKDAKAIANYSIQITDMMGRTVKTITDINTKEFQLSRNGISNGIYFYKVFESQNLIGVGKIVIK